MSTPTPAPQPPAVLISTVRTITPVIVAWLVYALAKANLNIDSTTLSVVVSGALSSVAAAAYTAGIRWLESHKATWWGKLFIIAKQPAYAAIGSAAPILADDAATYIAKHEAPPDDAGLTEVGIIVISVVLSVALFLIAHAAWPATF